MDRVWTNFGLGQSLDKLWTWTKPGIYKTYQIFEIGQSLDKLGQSTDKLWTWTKPGLSHIQSLRLGKVWKNFGLGQNLDKLWIWTKSGQILDFQIFWTWCAIECLEHVE